MVQGINVNNYSVAQLKEMKNAGFQGITDDDIKAAEKKEAEVAKNDKASDEAQVDYTIKDDAGEVNEAEQEVKTASEYGANLKTILANLIPKCQAKNDEMAALNAEMEQFVVKMEDLGVQAQDVSAEAQAKVDETQAKVDAEVEKAEAKQEELEAQTEIVENVANNENATEADKAKAEDAADNVEKLSTEVTDANSKIEDMQNKTKELIQQTAVTKATLLGKSMEDVKNLAESKANDAKNANEYADVITDKGMEASNINGKKEAKNAGFTKKVMFWKKGDVKAAHRMGDVAIATGQQLGNSSVNAAKTIQQVGNQYGFSFAETSSVNELANKTYVDTSKLDSMQNPKDIKDVRKALGSGVKSHTIHDIAEEAKKKKTEEAAAQAGTTGTTEA